MLKLLIIVLTMIFGVVLSKVITLYEFLYFVTGVVLIVSAVSGIGFFAKSVSPFEKYPIKSAGYMIVSLLVLGIFVCLKIKYF